MSLASCSKEQTPSLKDTLAWMDQTYNPHDGGANLGQGRGWQTNYSVGKVVESFHQTFSYRGCNITIHTETEPVGVFQDTPSSDITNFNLRDIDPQSIKISKFDSTSDGESCDNPESVQTLNLSCDETEIQFETRNQAPAIDDEFVKTFNNFKGADHESRQKSKESGGRFFVNSVEFSSRFAKAFRHAIELCGGTPSPF